MNPKVLVVDDDAAHRMFARRALERIVPQTDILEAATIADAQQSLVKYELGLIVLDLNLDNESGLELVTAVPNSTEIVIVSTSDLPEDIERCRVAGIEHYIPKGRSLPDFVDRLEDLVRSQMKLAETLHYS